jgi:hypothetical protein
MQPGPTSSKGNGLVEAWSNAVTTHTAHSNAQRDSAEIGNDQAGNHHWHHLYAIRLWPALDRRQKQSCLCAPPAHPPLLAAVRPDAAAAAQLLVAPGGDASVIARVKPFLEAHGRLLPTLDTPDKVHLLLAVGLGCASL